MKITAEMGLHPAMVKVSRWAGVARLSSVDPVVNKLLLEESGQHKIVCV